MSVEPASEDSRNVIDRFKGVEHQQIIDELDQDDHGLAIALENIERDFSAGSIVRSANAFGVRRVYIVGRKQWNKRGAMATNKYLHIQHCPTTAEFVELMNSQDRQLIAVDNVPGSRPLAEVTLPKNAVLVFGNEGLGLSAEMLASCQATVAIEQFGSTRSINVGAAAAIVMYRWLQQNVLHLDAKDDIIKG